MLEEGAQAKVVKSFHNIFGSFLSNQSMTIGPALNNACSGNDKMGHDFDAIGARGVQSNSWKRNWDPDWDESGDQMDCAEVRASKFTIVTCITDSHCGIIYNSLTDVFVLGQLDARDARAQEKGFPRDEWKRVEVLRNS